MPVDDTGSEVLRKAAEEDTPGDNTVYNLRIIAASGSTFALTGFKTVIDTILKVKTTSLKLRVGVTNQSGRRVIIFQPKDGEVFVRFAGVVVAGDAGDGIRIAQDQLVELAFDADITPEIISEVAAGDGVRTFVAEAK